MAPARFVGASARWRICASSQPGAGARLPYGGLVADPDGDLVYVAARDEAGATADYLTLAYAADTGEPVWGPSTAMGTATSPTA